MCKSVKKNKINSSFYHTLIKVSLLKLAEFIRTNDTVLIERQIKYTQKTLSESLQNCGQDQFLLDADSKFHKLINDSPAALLSLEKAFEVNKRSPYIALRLSRVYESNNDLDKSIEVLSESLKIDAFNKELNHKMGLLLFRKDPSNLLNSLYHLKRGFTPGDSNHQFQYDYARVLFLNNQSDIAKDIFDYLRDVPISLTHKRAPRDLHKINNILIKYVGSIMRIALDYAIIKVDGSGSLVYARTKRSSSFRSNDRVTFNTGFNYYGPLAINLSKINRS